MFMTVVSRAFAKHCYFVFNNTYMEFFKTQTVVYLKSLPIVADDYDKGL